MRRARVFAGLGGIAFGALTVVGFALAGPPGGSYKVANITALRCSWLSISACSELSG